MKNPYLFGGFFLANFNYKIEESWEFLTKKCPPVEVSPIYIYICLYMYYQCTCMCTYISLRWSSARRQVPGSPLVCQRRSWSQTRMWSHALPSAPPTLTAACLACTVSCSQPTQETLPQPWSRALESWAPSLQMSSRQPRLSWRQTENSEHRSWAFFCTSIPVAATLKTSFLDLFVFCLRVALLNCDMEIDAD